MATLGAHRSLPRSRDIKAENVLLHADGRWLLCDFGSTSSKQQAGRRVLCLCGCLRGDVQAKLEGRRMRTLGF